MTETTNCEHGELHFGSGGFYIICAKCRVFWVAKGDGPDVDLDHARQSPLAGRSGTFKFMEAS